VTPGFDAVREPGQTICVAIELEDGSMAFGEGGSVTYAGIAGRDPVFRAAEAVTTIDRTIAPTLAGADLERFRVLEDALRRNHTSDSQQLHSGIVYAVTQALLRAVALAHREPPLVTIAREWGLGIPPTDPEIGIQTGDDRYAGVDKAIYRRVDAFPHGLIKTVPGDFGERGELLLEYARWIIARMAEHGVPDDYRPTIHFDCYGTIGRAFDLDIAAVAQYILTLADAVAPLPLQIEAPIEAETQSDQIRLMRQLRENLRTAPYPRPQLIADEWCNTLADVRAFADAQATDMIQIKMPDLGPLGDSIEAAVICRQHGVGAYLGGSCNETDLSATMAVHVGLATGCDQILARPGMGIDEAVSIMRNELARTRLWLRNHRDSTRP
jgi:methylaspartate ammonia-lyase